MFIFLKNGCRILYLFILYVNKIFVGYNKGLCCDLNFNMEVDKNLRVM